MSSRTQSREPEWMQSTCPVFDTTMACARNKKGDLEQGVVDQPSHTDDNCSSENQNASSVNGPACAAKNAKPSAVSSSLAITDYL